MNSSERFITALENDVPDRVPIFLQMLMPKFEQMVRKSFSVPSLTSSNFILFNQDYNYMYKLGIDASWGFVDIWKPGKGQNEQLKIETLLLRNHLKDLKSNTEHYLDYEGRIWRKSDESHLGFDWYCGNHVKNIQQAENWVDSFSTTLPDINYNTLFDLNQQIRVFPKEKFTPIFMIEKIFEPIWQGFGLSVLAQLRRKNIRLLHKILNYRKKLVDFQLDHLLELDFDVFCMEDASAYKNSSIVSADFHNNFIKPIYSSVVNKIHKAGKHIFFHSDGNFTELIPFLIQANFEGVGGLEVDAGMDLCKLKKKFGESLAFIGNFRTGILNSDISLPELRDEINSTLSCGMANGGYIFAPDTDIFSHCSIQRFEELIRTVRKYGVYK